MADDRKTLERPLQRTFECHRLQEQLWSLAYQRLWPLIRRKIPARGAKTQTPRCNASGTAAPNARRA
jgi:hypothetical protein